MDKRIKLVTDTIRGCGRRKETGIYLRSDGMSAPCGRLPIELQICPCCGSGVKWSKGWTWINLAQFARGKECEGRPSDPFAKPTKGRKVSLKVGSGCDNCPLSDENLPNLSRAGLLWIGKEFYEFPAQFLREASEQGVSRRIKAVPNDFKIGETWVALAHANGMANPDGTYSPAIFRVFKPDRIEYVCSKEDETDKDKIDSLLKRGITPVKIEKVIGDTGELFEDDDEDVD